jgi:hypothetical protein
LPNVLRMSGTQTRWDDCSFRRPLDALVGLPDADYRCIARLVDGTRTNTKIPTPSTAVKYCAGAEKPM